MKQKGISESVNKGFKKIDSHFYNMTAGFEVESVHDFRTEIKKLRAFLRLLNVETANDRLKISKKIKRFYAYAGAIRNLQLQLQNISGYLESSRHPVIEVYVEYLKKMIEKRTTDTIGFCRQEKNFRNDQKKIQKNLPEKLRRVSSKTFLHDKMNELACLLKESPGDDVLHSIRKILKDISYNWEFIKPYSKLLPPDFSEKEKIKSFMEMLGLFMDKSVGIILLETYCRDCEENGTFTEEDIKKLQEIEKGWKREKGELMQIIYINPGLQQFLSFV